MARHTLAIALPMCLMLPVSTLMAASFDPIVELFRLGANDRLLIDRGGPVDLLGDVNGDGLDDLVVGSGVGGVRVIFGPTQGNNGELNGQQLDGVSGFTIAHDSVNISYVSSAGDINSDGLNDILVGSFGGVHVVFGSRAAYPRVLDVATLNGQTGFTINVSATSVSNAGDVNDDGLDDIIIGNANATINNLQGVGAAYVVYGKTTGFSASLDVSQISGSNGFAIIGAQSEDRIGHSVGAAGDFNHDGIDDLLIGAPNKTQGVRPEAGEAYVVYGQPNGFPSTISVADLTAGNGLVVVGVDNQDATGASVSGIGDLNHDGVDDIAIGAPGKGPFGSPSDYPGEVYILFGGKFGGVAQLNRAGLDGNNGVRVRGIRGGVVPIEAGEAIWGDLAGTSIDGLGDFNGDGLDDMIIGASHTIINPSRKGVGQTYVVYGSRSAFPANLSLLDLDGSNGFRINGIGTVDYYGVYARSAGDFNDDGINDFIAGASGEGASYVIYGLDGGTGRIPPPAPVSFNSPPLALPEAARTVGANARPLAFNELADPTGPTPISVGAPTDLNDPATPGFIAANVLEPVAVLRPGQVPNSEPTTDTGTSTEPSEPPQPPINPVSVSDVPAAPTLDTDLDTGADATTNGGTTPNNGATELPAVPTSVLPDDAIEAAGSNSSEGSNSPIRVGSSDWPLIFACLLLLGVRTREKS